MRDVDERPDPCEAQRLHVAGRGLAGPVRQERARRVHRRPELPQLRADNTSIDGAVVPLNAMGWADSDGNLTYSLDTTGLPSGAFSLVAHGLNSDQEELLMFTVK